MIPVISTPVLPFFPEVILIYLIFIFYNQEMLETCDLHSYSLSFQKSILDSQSKLQVYMSSILLLFLSRGHYSTYFGWIFYDQGNFVTMVTSTPVLFLSRGQSSTHSVEAKTSLRPVTLILLLHGRRNLKTPTS
jgi:hypothetical protein